MSSYTTLESVVSALASLPRTGWLIRGVEHPETVADHTFGTLIIAFLMESVTTADEPAPSPDILAMALIHDLVEVYFGDLTPRTKKYIPMVAAGLSHSEYENNYVSSFLELLPENSKQYLSQVWSSFWGNKSPGAKQIHIIDIVEMLSQAYEYEKAGQRKLDEFWSWVANCRGNDFLFKLAKTIERKRNFLRFTPATKYQHFESASHHSSQEFSDKINKLDPGSATKRDEVLANFFATANLTHDTLYEILDVGCGLGSFARYFLENSNIQSHVTGIDINAFLLQEAKMRWKDRRYSVMPPIDIGWYWDVESEEFDVVLIGEVLEHVFDPWFVLMEAFRVLKPGGFLCISVPNSFHGKKKDRMLKTHRIELRYREEHIRYFGPENLVDLISETGFSVDGFFGLSENWKEIIEIDHTTPANNGLFKNTDDCWTLVACCRKKGPHEINQIGETPSPNRNGPNVLLSNRIEEHKTIREWTALHKFIEDINKAKLLRFDLADKNSESIAQQTVKLMLYALCISAELGLRTDVAMRNVLIQGIIEAHLAEFLPSVRYQLKSQTKRAALEDVVSILPPSVAERYIDFFDGYYCNSEEGLIAQYLLNREYRIANKAQPEEKFVSLLANGKVAKILNKITGCDFI